MMKITKASDGSVRSHYLQAFMPSFPFAFGGGDATIRKLSCFLRLARPSFPHFPLLSGAVTLHHRAALRTQGARMESSCHVARALLFSNFLRRLKCHYNQVLFTHSCHFRPWSGACNGQSRNNCKFTTFTTILPPMHRSTS